MAKNAQEEALKLLGSPRGQYIVGQALAIAIKELEKEKPHKQESNISDMKFLGESLFKAGYVTHTMLSEELIKKIHIEVGNNPDKLIQDEELVKQINDEVNAVQNNGQSKDSKGRAKS